MKKYLTILLFLILTNCSNANCDYVIQYDAAFHQYYIYSCRYYVKFLEIGYGSFKTEEEAIKQINKIRIEGLDPNKQTHFIEVPK